VTLEQPFQLQVRLFPAIQGEVQPHYALRPTYILHPLSDMAALTTDRG